MAQDRGCDNLVPNNVDCDDNSNKLGPSPATVIDYMHYMAKEAHYRRLPICLKTAGSIFGDVPPIVE
jgi:hypothetical protein